MKKKSKWTAMTALALLFYYWYFFIQFPSWPFVQHKTRVHYTNAVHVED